MTKSSAFIPLILILTAALLLAAAYYGITTSQTPNGQHDTDGDRLIEVSNLEHKSHNYFRRPWSGWVFRHYGKFQHYTRCRAN